MYQEQNATLGQTVTPLDAVGINTSRVVRRCIPRRCSCALSLRKGRCSAYRHVYADSEREINPYLLVAADIAGVDEIYRVGGCRPSVPWHSGTKTIAKVDKIVGPGTCMSPPPNVCCNGTVGIDMVAGPSELLVVADDDANRRMWRPTCSVKPNMTRMRGVPRDDVGILAKEVGAFDPGATEGAAAGENRRRNRLRGILLRLLFPQWTRPSRLQTRLHPSISPLSVDRPFDYLEQVRHAGALF